MPYRIVTGSDTMQKVNDYLTDLTSGRVQPGAFLKRVLAGAALNSNEAMIDALLATKQPQIFAESQICGDGSDWNMRELSILGDINVAMKAYIFDNGAWSVSDPHFKKHAPPLQGHLLFTPGALLQANAPDLAEVSDGAGGIDRVKYNALIERRLWPLLSYANDSAKQEGVDALVVLPGIGCGAFAGKFRGQVGGLLNGALKAMLQKHANELPQVAGIFFDPFNECTGEDAQFGNVKYRVRPSAQYPGRPQLSAPADFGGGGDDFSQCRLYKMVAWDHASLPGNDYFIASRFTDDGVSAAASNSMETVTGVKGHYNNGEYLPPSGYKDWKDVAVKNNVHLRSHDIYMPEAKRVPGAWQSPGLRNASFEDMQKLWKQKPPKP